ncbi:hypothetical protein [Streptomyces violaceusniger]|uniref:Uncharacterized protein n=1 Tax=Streptomyces violaceusniger TaxID=68280 RepID=A0A4D4LG22_STRVO|nr:hypothetical protein SVIO_112140 [Streptomyces violaceusniger]
MPLPVRTRRPDVAVAAIMRSIGRRPRPTPIGFVCQPCSVSWVGEEGDCWNCGRPASSKHTRDSVLQILLAAVEGVEGDDTAPSIGRADQ